MVKKIFGMIAIAAFIATAAFSAAEAVVQQDTIWVYLTGPSGATQTPDCEMLSEENCAQLFEWDGSTIGEPVKDENDEYVYLKGRRIL